jgi:hypothetical protein
MTDVAAMPAQGGWNAGSAIYSTALELRVHGHPHEAGAFFRRAVEWIRARPAPESATDARRSLLARSLYQAGDWTGADTIFRALSAAHAQNVRYLGWVGLTAAQRGDTAGADRVSAALDSLDVPYLHGVNTVFRARLAAVLGRRDQAVRLVRQARAEGLQVEELHLAVELIPLRGLPPFDELVRPAG